MNILEEAGIIEILKKSRTIYIIDTTGIEFDGNGSYYFKVPLDYIYKLMNEKKAFALLHQYLLLCSTINVQKKYGCTSQETFVKNYHLDMDVRTVGRRHKRFEELAIICFSEHRNGVDKNGNFVNLPKLYAMPYDADVLGESRENHMANVVKNAKRKKKDENIKNNSVPKKAESDDKYLEKNTIDWLHGRNPFCL